MVEPLRHRQTKGAATDMFFLTPPRHISTLPNSEVRMLNREVDFALNNRHRPPSLSGPRSANALNRCAIARGGLGGGHRYGAIRGEIVGSVWGILS
jgi:hypothetical protein